MTDFKPRPTEYKGTRFRSKSEAIFVRALDLMTEKTTMDCLLWEYEPEWFAVGDYVPDLFTAWQDRSTSVEVGTGIVEYKPSQPTATYIDEWKEKAEAWKRCGASPLLVWGGPYKGDYRMTCFSGGEWKEFDKWPFGSDRYAEEASRYRFDLKEAV